MKSLPKEWLILAVIAITIAVIALLDWNKSSSQPSQTNNSNLGIKDTSDGGKTTILTPPRWSNQNSAKQEKEEANVTVEVEYLAVKSDGKNITFNIALNTHSVNLDSFDFQKDIVLEKDGKSTTPSKISTNGGGHHRSSEIVFPNTSPPFTIVLKNLANINRREFLFEKL